MSPPSQFNMPLRRASSHPRHISITPDQEYHLRKLSSVSGQNELELARERLQAEMDCQAHSDDQPEPRELPFSTEDTGMMEELEIQVVDADTVRCLGCTCQKIKDWIRLRCGPFHYMLP